MRGGREGETDLGIPQFCAEVSDGGKVEGTTYLAAVHYGGGGGDVDVGDGWVVGRLPITPLAREESRNIDELVVRPCDSSAPFSTPQTNTHRPPTSRTSR